VLSRINHQRSSVRYLRRAFPIGALIAASLGLAGCRYDVLAQNARDMLVGVYERFTEGFETPDLKAARCLLDELDAALLLGVGLVISAACTNLTSPPPPAFLALPQSLQNASPDIVGRSGQSSGFARLCYRSGPFVSSGPYGDRSLRSHLSSIHPRIFCFGS
jgi:hypothetical protein